MSRPVTFIKDKIIDTEVSYRVEVQHGGIWTDMPGFAQSTEDAAREGARALVDLADDVQLVKVTVVTGVRREVLEL